MKEKKAKTTGGVVEGKKGQKVGEVAARKSLAGELEARRLKKEERGGVRGKAKAMGLKDVFDLANTMRLIKSHQR